MFGLKPTYPNDYFTESRKICDTRKGYWTVREYFSPMSRLEFSFWKYQKNLNFSGIQTAIWNKKITIPLSWRAFYIQYIYHHLGKCHPDLRSKYFVGKAVETTWNK